LTAISFFSGNFQFSLSISDYVAYNILSPVFYQVFAHFDDSTNFVSDAIKIAINLNVPYDLIDTYGTAEK
jgi:hypothetical protein